MNYDDKTITQMLSDPKKQRQAFSMVVSQYSEPLYWKIRRIVLNHDDANDVLQNVFLKAWNNGVFAFHLSRLLRTANCLRVFRLCG